MPEFYGLSGRVERRTTGIPYSPVTIRAIALPSGSIEHVEHNIETEDFFEGQYHLTIRAISLSPGSVEPDRNDIEVVDIGESLGLPPGLFPPVLKVRKVGQHA